MSRSFLDANIPDLVKKLSVDEKIKLLSAPNWWNTHDVKRLDIPAVRMSDGPNVRNGFSALLTSINISCRASEALHTSFLHLLNVYRSVS